MMGMAAVANVVAIAVVGAGFKPARMSEAAWWTGGSADDL